MKILLFALILFLTNSFNRGIAADRCPQWSSQQAESEIQQLAQQIKQWDQAYHHQGLSLVDDQRYDQLLSRLHYWQRCFDHPVSHYTPPYTIGSDLPVHSGLHKVKTLEQLKPWLALRQDLWIQPKIDGVAATLIYHQGQLTRAYSRQGQDWSRHVLKIPSIPKVLPLQDDLILQGELFWLMSEHIQSRDGGQNARANVAGALLSQQLDEDKAKQIGFWLWEWPDGPLTMPERLEKLAEYGFTLGVDDTRQVESVEEILHWRDYWYHHPQPFASDGVVIRQGHRPPLDKWQKSPPSWAIGWKYPILQQITEVENIEFRIGRTGRITAIAHLQPVQIDDKRVKRVNLGSLQHWLTLDLYPHDQVQIGLAGHGIPYLHQVVWRTEHRQTITVPDQQRYHRESCLTPEPDCQQQFIARLVWLTGKQGLKLRGTGPALWHKLLEQGLLEDLTSWLSLSRAQVESIGSGAAEIYQQFQAARQKPLEWWLNGLAIKPDETLIALIEQFNCNQTTPRSDDVSQQLVLNLLERRCQLEEATANVSTPAPESIDD